MKKHQIRLLKNIISAILVVLIFLCCFIALVNISFNSLYIKTPIKGYSMYPTLNSNVPIDQKEGDIVYINKGKLPKLNDIVVADVDLSEDIDMIIKRVVGTPGDKIEIRDLGNCFGVFTNDILLYSKEKYGNKDSFPKSGSYLQYDYYTSFLTNPEFSQWVKTENEKTFIELGENEYFLMGDNWGKTTDCLTFGPIKSTKLVGVVDHVIDYANEDPFAEFKFFLKQLFSK